tara:strand:- start:347 stop:451 length:105 start_codon:yes stop_codon:yes gene_type:complete
MPPYFLKLGENYASSLRNEKTKEKEKAKEKEKVD